MITALGKALLIHLTKGARFMKKCAFFWVVIVILAFQVGMLTSVQADVVGSLTQVEGRVDLLRGGQLPAIPVKLNDGVQTGDVIRTKSLSKAQITFIDNSTLTIAPESRVGIESYMFNSTQNKRNSVVQLFQGLAHVAVSKIFKAAEPDFVVKTQTAIMGVRGTDFGVRVYPNSSDVLNFEGLLQVGNRLRPARVRHIPARPAQQTRSGARAVRPASIALPIGHQQFAAAVAVHRGHHAGHFHCFDQARGAVVADA